jgi:hypothetical protein
MKQTTIRNALLGLLLATGSTACGGEAPGDLQLAQSDEALSKFDGLIDAKTGSYISAIRFERAAKDLDDAPTLVLSNSDKSVQASLCNEKWCEDVPLSSLTFVGDDGVVGSDDLVLGTTDEKGDVHPVQVGKYFFLCRTVDGEAECIPWFPPED